MTQCEHCGRDTPDEPFCTWCGAHRSAPEGEAVSRRKDYAAQSGENVSQPSVITTLLPHLPRHRVHEFRWGLIGGLAIVVALVGGGLVVAAILAAAVLVPSLYLVYLYEAQVYRDEPAKTLGLTMASGVVLGVVLSIIAKALWPASLVHPGTGAGYLIGACVVWPLVQEIVKPIPVLGLRGSPKFSETIDGLTFGVASGLGFAAAETIVNFSRVISEEPIHIASGNWLAEVLGLTILTPLLQGTCTGIIVAVLWKPSRLSQPLYLLGIPLALGGHVLYSIISQVLQNASVSLYVVLFFQAAVVGVLLVYTRHLVHDALLDEAKDFGFQVVTCPHCRHTVGAAGFCPLCGGAITAGPRTALVTVAPSPGPEEPLADAPNEATPGGASA
jgi:RsiW-degrading membrane proteinase PrsW (M82 family)